MALKRPSKLGFGPLALLDWLCEAPPGDRMFSRGSGMGRNHLWLFEAAPPDAEGIRKLTRHIPGPDAGGDGSLLARLGGKASFETYGLTREGFRSYQHSMVTQGAEHVRRWKDFSERYETRWFHYTDNVYLPEPEAYAYWRDTGKPRLDVLRGERAEALRLTERTVLLRGTWATESRLPADLVRILPEGFRIPVAGRTMARPFATARVVKETPTRLYVEDVRPLKASGTGRWAGEVLNRSGDGTWVEPGSVWVDPARQKVTAALRAATDEYLAEDEEELMRAMREIAPVLAQLDARLAQKAARRDDEIRTALESAPGPDHPDGDGP